MFLSHKNSKTVFYVTTCLNRFMFNFFFFFFFKKKRKEKNYTIKFFLCSKIFGRKIKLFLIIIILIIFNILKFNKN